MKRTLCALAALFALAGASPAAAADSALLVPVGFSENLRYFAFEELGIQDGSGFAYSSIYIIDIAEDRWVVGTPVRVVATSEEETLSTVRSQTYNGAAPRLDNLAVDVPAHEIASNGDGQPDIDAKKLKFALPIAGNPDMYMGDYALSLETFETGSGAPCMDWFDAQPLGFLLKLTSDGATSEVHRDGVLPRSRACPADYRIHSVYVPFNATDLSHAVAIISVYSRGFEGLDRRFIGVSLSPGNN